ncbi:NAD-dependent epimerase/dehydratase family protein [Sphingomonas baiyangensis]|uniref:NAD-dependent epimerase/dehydratase family protein n=1 Tax=Sphingomonas baiyangensis TaxID=2572576 RepID=A0A4V5PTU5_9SPHN|nr:NAD-dependent epimerase/dehydratase family protein [Sphingomonas baiyangensis]TKD51358.1 NAD-dependent epimerase/dehydratase family protein [Sphingomonas baiyangensis]
MSVLAVTGGTGFVGTRLIDAALAAGHTVRALARREQPPRAGVTWIAGALDDTDALERLCAGADAVIHVAGVVNAPDRAGFVAGNVAGTRAMLAAASATGVDRFVHVSSLAAREPQLSVYGWSKAEAERLVAASDRAFTIMRPPAIYGPGDREMLEMFRLARRGVVPLPPEGRFSTLHVDDLARLLLALAATPGDRAILEADDETPRGWRHVDFARALGEAVGRRRVLPLPLPRAVMAAGARIARATQGNAAKLTPDRVAYFCHPDWTVADDRRPAPALWRPAIETRAGLAATAEWYRVHGLL